MEQMLFINVKCYRVYTGKFMLKTKEYATIIYNNGLPDPVAIPGLKPTVYTWWNTTFKLA